MYRSMLLISPPSTKARDFLSVYCRVVLALLLLVCRVLMLSGCLVAEKTSSFRTHVLLPIQVLVGIHGGIAGAGNWSKRIGNAIAMGMSSPSLNRAMVGHSMSCGKSEVTGVEVSPRLLAVSWVFN